MSIIKCPNCGKETNTVFIDPSNNYCYLTISKEDNKKYWRRGCIPKIKDKQNPYFVYSAKQSLDKEIE